MGQGNGHRHRGVTAERAATTSVARTPHESVSRPKTAVPMPSARACAGRTQATSAGVACSAAATLGSATAAAAKPKPTGPNNPQAAEP